MSAPSDPTPDLFAVFRVVRTWTDAAYPDHAGAELVIHQPGRKPTRIMIPAYPRRDAARGGTPREPQRWRHSTDYREVHWHGQVYRFSKTQAAVVELLDQARQLGEPDMDQNTILRQISSNETRLNQLFRRGDGLRAWGTLIVQGETAGSYRLADRPTDPPTDTAA